VESDGGRRLPRFAFSKGIGVRSESKVFFFEKKKQKTFDCLSCGLSG
jgi:hypothetical protein